MVAKLFKNNYGKPVIRIEENEFLLTNGFQLQKALEKLRSLNTGMEIKFENFIQLRYLVERINNLDFIDLDAVPTNK